MKNTEQNIFLDVENTRIHEVIKQIEKWFFLKIHLFLFRWWQEPRWEGIVRPYKPKDIAVLRNSIDFKYPSGYMSKKLFTLLKELDSKKDFSHTFGALDPIQITNMVKYLKTVYVSGWQCSSTASTTNEPGPDFADYPYNTVPNKVDQSKIYEITVFKGWSIV